MGILEFIIGLGLLWLTAFSLVWAEEKQQDCIDKGGDFSFHLIEVSENSVSILKTACDLPDGTTITGEIVIGGFEPLPTTSASFDESN